MNKNIEIRRIENQMKDLFNKQKTTQTSVNKFNSLLSEWKELTNHQEAQSNPITAEPYQGNIR